MYDSTTAADVPAGSDLVMGYVDGRHAWSDADWQRFPGRILVRLCIYNDRYDAHVIDLEPGNNDARGAVPWIREKWLRAQTPTVYCFSDKGPVGYRISDVRAECDAASLTHPQFLITDFDDVAVIPDDPEIIGKQYADAALTGGHYDASVVADHWPGIDKEADMDEATVTAIIKAYLATTYGPALEAELTQRIADAVAPNIDTIAAAVEARIAAKLAAQ